MESRSTAFEADDVVLLVPDTSCNAAFADFQCVPARFAIRLDPRVDPLAMVMAQQLGTVIFALRRFWPTGAPRTATVIGAGPAGLMFVELLKAAGCDRVIVSDLEPHRLAEAVRRGAHVAVDARSTSVVEATLDSTAGDGAELVVEAAGHDSTRASAVECVAVNGTIGLFGLPERVGDAPLPLGLMFARRPTIHVSARAQHEPGLISFRRAVQSIAARETGCGLVSHVLDIESVATAFELARSRRDGALKVGLGWPTG